MKFVFLVFCILSWTWMGVQRDNMRSKLEYHSVIPNRDVFLNIQNARLNPLSENRNFDYLTSTQPSPESNLPIHFRSLLKINPSPVANDLRKETLPLRVDPRTGKPAPQDFDYTEETYFYGILGIAIPSLIVGLLFPISGIIFICGRTICNTFGGWFTDPDGYPPWQSSYSRVVLLFTSLILIFTCVVGLLGNEKFRDASTLLFFQISSTADDIVTDIDIITENLLFNRTFLSSEAQETLLFPELNKTIVEYKGLLEAQQKWLKDEFDYYNEIRSDIYFFGFIFCLVTGIIGFLSMYNKIGWPLFFATIMAWLSGGLLWVSFSFHYSAAVIISDLCVIIASIANVFVFNPSTSIFLPCTVEFNSSVDNTLTNIAYFNGQLSQLSANLTAANETEKANQVESEIEKTNLATNALLRLFSCDFVQRLALLIHDTICEDLLGSFTTLFRTQGVIAGVFFAFIPASIVGRKRFDQRPWGKKIEQSIGRRKYRELHLDKLFHDDEDDITITNNCNASDESKTDGQFYSDEDGIISVLSTKVSNTSGISGDKIVSGLASSSSKFSFGRNLLFGRRKRRNIFKKLKKTDENENEDIEVDTVLSIFDRFPDAATVPVPVEQSEYSDQMSKVSSERNSQDGEIDDNGPIE